METTREDLVMSSAYDFCPSGPYRLSGWGKGDSIEEGMGIPDAHLAFVKKNPILFKTHFFRISYRNVVMCSLSKHNKNFGVSGALNFVY